MMTPLSETPVLDRIKSMEPRSFDAASLAIPTLGEGEQYRFHFDMTRCIGCRCCEVACNEQNNNPAHVKWRRVGEIEGGSYPHVHRLHVSMSCNHCLEPSCLEGCPVDAYTKLSNGIVAHSAEACIGCQYCTWNCPYGVPQYHPERRVVTKCHMCADRMAGGEFPACVEACPSSAIEIEKVNVLEWRRAIAEANAPGVPPADLTLSTTRITLPEDLPENMGETEAQLLEPEAPHWPLVFLLVLSQWSVGLFAASLLFALAGTSSRDGLAARALDIVSAASLGAFAVGLLSLGASIFHLGRPIHAWRALKAWRRSWLSREVLCFSIFIALGAAAALARAAQGPVLLLLTVLAGIAGIISSAGIYLIPARPAWNTWRTPLQFFLTALSLGSASGLVLLCARPFLAAEQAQAAGGTTEILAWSLAAAASLSACLQALIPWTLAAAGLGAETGAHGGSSAIRAAAILLTRHFGRLLWVRTLLLPASAILFAMAAARGSGMVAVLLAAGGLVLALAAELAGRYLFFVTVVPRNMPGHFFSRNGAGH
ncbi:MAG TPA: DmsC/YnfH family molybdoenzyme membrane anchor subunit [Planctomycetota bacterium]|nr:DmsC/YnfH family molybdoenzyme membrane anchor subunit [Planctomycetota bacterium]